MFCTHWVIHYVHTWVSLSWIIQLGNTLVAFWICIVSTHWVIHCALPWYILPGLSSWITSYFYIMRVVHTYTHDIWSGGVCVKVNGKWSDWDCALGWGWWKRNFFFAYNVSGHSGSPSLPVCHIHPGLSSRGVTHYSRCQHRYGGVFLRVFGGLVYVFRTCRVLRYWASFWSGPHWLTFLSS